jgi:hypothetical protein
VEENRRRRFVVAVVAVVVVVVVVVVVPPVGDVVVRVGCRGPFFRRSGLTNSASRRIVNRENGLTLLDFFYRTLSIDFFFFGISRPGTPIALGIEKKRQQQEQTDTLR